MITATPPVSHIRQATDAAVEKQATARIEDLISLVNDLTQKMRLSCLGALRIGLRLLIIHRETADSDAPGGFRAALAKLEGSNVPPSTAYRWMNAAGSVMARAQGTIENPSATVFPDWIPSSPEWKAADQVLVEASNGMSLRRLLIGSSAISDESRFDSLITAAEAGDRHAEAALDAVAKGKITLVQAIRGASGAAATKEKHRADPIYLDIDGSTGQPTGLFPKCLVTLANTFARWDTLDETARLEARKSWKALVAALPKELR